jgi:hypothetical protein
MARALAYERGIGSQAEILSGAMGYGVCLFRALLAN